MAWAEGLTGIDSRHQAETVCASPFPGKDDVDDTNADRAQSYEDGLVSDYDFSPGIAKPALRDDQL